MTKIIYIMGVSGCGKSTIGIKIASALAIPFFDGDDYHPKENVDKMQSGIPLNDQDRQGWLETLNKLAIEHLGKGAVIACSALKEKYRTLLQKGIENESEFLFLQGSFDEIQERLNLRKGHYMPASLLQSQFDALETPEKAVVLSIKNTPEELKTLALEKLNV